MTTEHIPSCIEELLAHREWVRRLARRLVADENRADDLEQETWARALAHPPRHGGAPRGWLGRVVRSVWIDTHRSESQRALRELAVARPEAARPPDVVAEADAHRRVVQAAYDLDEPYRTTLLLRYFEGRSVREIAARLGVSDEAVKTRLRRAVERIREQLDGDSGGRRDAWRAALLPLAWGTGGVTMKTSQVAVVASIVLAMLAGGAWWTFRSDAPVPAPSETEIASSSASPAPEKARVGRTAPPAAPSPFPGNASLTGEVRTRPDGQPVAGARIVLADRSTDDAGASVSFTTGADGRFAFPGIAPGRDFTLRATSDTASSPPRRIARLGPAEARDLGTIWLVATGDVEVTVTSEAGSVEGALVEVFANTRSLLGATTGWTQSEDHDAGGVPAVSARTGADGPARLPRVPAGDVVLVVRHAGAAIAVRPWLRVPAGVMTRTTVALEPAAQFEGRLVDAARRPLAGLRVAGRTGILGQEFAGLATYATAESDADGRFVLDGLQAGTATVCLRTVGGLVSLGQVRVPMEGAFEFVVAWRAVEGLVTETTEGRPVPGATVSAMLFGGDSSMRLVTAVTGADGRYRLESPVPANFSGLEASAPGLAPAEILPPQRAVRPAAGETMRQDLRVAPAASVAGVVSQRLADGTLRPVAGADVIVYWGNGNLFLRRDVKTDASGAYVADSLPPARLAVVQVVAPGLSQDSFDWNGYMQVLMGQGEASPAWSLRTEAGKRSRLDISMSVAVATRVVSGTVTDRHGAPAVGASVHGGAEATTTGSAGTFRLAGVPVGDATLFARTEYSGSGRLLIQGDADIADARIVLSSPILRGTVSTADGGPRPDGTVVRVIYPDTIGPHGDEDATWRASPPIAVARNGSFEVALFSAGKIRVRAEAPGWVQERPTTLDATESEKPHEVALVLDRAQRIEGRVVDDETGAPVAGARVLVALRAASRAGQIQSPVPAAGTDAGGRFVVPDLGPGSFPGNVEAEGYVAQSLTFDVPAAAAPLVVRMRRAKLLFAGIVVGPDRRPVADCSVSASAAGPGDGSRGPWSSTGADGRFELRGAGTGGAWTVMAYPPQGRGFPNRWVKIPGVAEGRTDIEIVLAGALRIGGRVLSSAGLPVRGVVVMARATSGDLASAQATTGDSGEFAIEGLDERTYDVRADAPCSIDGDAMVSVCGDLVTTLTGVAAGTTNVAIRLDAGGRVEGVLVGEDERPRGGAWIVAFPAQRNAAAQARRPGNSSTNLGGRTDASGRFDFGGLPPGRYRLVLSEAADASGTNRTFTPLSGGEDVAAGATGLRLRVAALGVIAGRVVDESGAGVGDVSVEAIAGPAAPSAAGAGWGRTAADGTFRVERLDTGRTYALRAWKHGEFAPSVVEGVAPRASDVVIRVAAGLRLTGRVVDRNGNPLGGVFEVVPESGARGTSFSTGDDGRFDVAGLTAGPHRLEARAVQGPDGKYLQGGADVRPGDRDVEVRISE